MATVKFLRGGGHLPSGARRAGHEPDRTLLYVARAAHDGGVQVGKYRADWKAASIPYGGSEVWVDQYEVWVGKVSDGSGGVWNPPNNASDAIACGRENDGMELYAARARHEGGWHIGKWRRDWKAAAIPFGGAEVWINRFEVLCPGQYFEGDPIFSGWDQ